MDSPCIKQTVCKVLKIFQYGKYLVAYVLNSSVMLGNYLQQTISADDIFRCMYFLGALRVKHTVYLQTKVSGSLAISICSKV